MKATESTRHFFFSSCKRLVNVDGARVVVCMLLHPVLRPPDMRWGRGEVGTGRGGGVRWRRQDSLYLGRRVTECPLYHSILITFCHHRRLTAKLLSNFIARPLCVYPGDCQQRLPAVVRELPARNGTHLTGWAPHFFCCCQFYLISLFPRKEFVIPRDQAYFSLPPCTHLVFWCHGLDHDQHSLPHGVDSRRTNSNIHFFFFSLLPVAPVSQSVTWKPSDAWVMSSNLGAIWIYFSHNAQQWIGAMS